VALAIVGAAKTVNAPVLVALPVPLFTTKLCVPTVKFGKVAVIEVAEVTLTLVKETPLIVAVVCPLTKFVPVIVTDPPEVIEPVEGEIAVIVGEEVTIETITIPDPPEPPVRPVLEFAAAPVPPLPVPEDCATGEVFEPKTAPVPPVP
jgi:hypothetical protein